MNKWTEAAKKRKAQIDDAGEKANDLMTLLNSLQHGQVKNLLKDEVCGAILEKYGVTS